MKSALFTNFTSEEFIGYWDGKPKKFAPGVSMYMPDYLAEHFAKHLTNRELLRTDDSGNLIHKGGDKMTSPKRPADAPMFMKLFNKAFTPDDEKEEEAMGDVKDDVDALINSANKNHEAKQNPNEPQTIEVPGGDEDDEDEKFEQKPIDQGDTNQTPADTTVPGKE